MSSKEIRIYEACDKAIQEMNRENLKAFGKLKLAKWEQLNIVRDITKLYHDSARRARQKYYEVAFEAYLLAMAMCEVEPKKAHQMAEKAITGDWVDEILEATDYVTLFRFTSETDRKAYRLIEAIGATDNRNSEIDKALRLWSRQLGQYAINFTDYAATKAFEDAGTAKVEWVSQKDGRVCSECRSLDGQIFPVDEIPTKPHWGCRCFWRAVLKRSD